MFLCLEQGPTTVLKKGSGIIIAMAKSAFIFLNGLFMGAGIWLIQPHRQEPCLILMARSSGPIVKQQKLVPKG